MGYSLQLEWKLAAAFLTKLYISLRTDNRSQVSLVLAGIKKLNSAKKEGIIKNNPYVMSERSTPLAAIQSAPGFDVA